jgi:hypothetical protein
MNIEKAFEHLFNLTKEDLYNLNMEDLKKIDNGLCDGEFLTKMGVEDKDQEVIELCHDIVIEKIKERKEKLKIIFEKSKNKILKPDELWDLIEEYEDNEEIQKEARKTIRSAVRTAYKEIYENSKEKKIEKSLELLGVNKETAHNYAESHFDTKKALHFV